MAIPDVTLAIAARNEPLLKATIESALATRDGINLEIVVVDDSTTDGSIDAVHKMRNLTIFRTRLNGASVSKSYALDQARAPRLILCDAHMLYPKGWLKAFVEAIDSYPKSLICCTSTPYRDDAQLRMYGCFWHFSKEYGFVGPIWIKKRPPKPIIEVPALMGACYGFSRETWDYLPGLPPVEGWGWLEAFLSATANMMGVRILLLRDVVVRHQYVTKHPYPQSGKHTHEIKRAATQILFDDLREEIQKARYGKVLDDSILNEKGKEQKAKLQAGRILTDWEWLTRNALIGGDKVPGLVFKHK